MAEKTETEIIRESVNKAAEHVSPLLTHAIRELRNDDARRLRELTDALYAIRDANEARDKARTPQMQVQVPDLSEFVCRGLLEIGFDVGIAASIDRFKTIQRGPGSMIAWNPPENPFRRASTTIEEPSVQAITEQNARAREAQHVCASTRGFECDCPGTLCKEGSP